jgi:acetaldehyde dehydrogenase/alcohol dehydrogenase
MHEKGNVTHIVVKVSLAQALYSTLTQEQVDCIFREAALAAADARIPLAHVAAEESGMGVIEVKVVKVDFVSKDTYCGQGEEYGIFVVTKPVGHICDAFPTTRTSTTTVQFIFSPHPRDRKSTCHTKFIVDSSIKAGEPHGAIGSVEEPTLVTVNSSMHHPSINFISVTGGPAMVKSTHSSGKSRRILKTLIQSIVDLIVTFVPCGCWSR